ncbi:MAG TPA: dethiobiotin synthase [Candidatus Anaerobiospirillum stercoravium]|nr:dethiobiotin synthase [Candidatus Anaerobiospirillum stercoravium]
MPSELKAHLEPIFITGTGTDIGKTYITALLCRALNDWLKYERALSTPETSQQAAVRYYKAAISGADSIAASDAGYVITEAGLNQDLATATTYLYREAVSPHLAYCNEVAAGKSPQIPALDQVRADFEAVYSSCALTVLEGSGGIYCPLWSDPVTLSAALAHPWPSGAGALVRGVAADCYTICDLMREISASYGLKLVIVANSKLGCINDVLTTVQSLKHEGFDLSRAVIILNHYDGSSLMQRNNVGMIEALTRIPVVATVSADQAHLELTPALKQFIRGETLDDAARRSLFQSAQGLNWWPETVTR